MLLGRNAIEQALAAGHIICDPAPATIEAVHIDLHLGEHFWLALPHYGDGLGAVKLADSDPHALYAPGCAEVAIIIPAHGLVLAHTQERAGSTVPWLCPFIETRSTLARWGIAVHLSAGWGDPGYCGRWTLEIYNYRPQAVAIPVGARVCSIGFHRVEGNDALYTERYNPAEWTPEAMLPRRGNV